MKNVQSTFFPLLHPHPLQSWGSCIQHWWCYYHASIIIQIFGVGLSSESKVLN